jgi:hypothetical protein
MRDDHDHQNSDLASGFLSFAINSHPVPNTSVPPFVSSTVERYFLQKLLLELKSQEKVSTIRVKRS